VSFHLAILPKAVSIAATGAVQQEIGRANLRQLHQTLRHLRNQQVECQGFGAEVCGVITHNLQVFATVVDAA